MVILLTLISIGLLLNVWLDSQTEQVVFFIVVIVSTILVWFLLERLERKI